MLCCAQLSGLRSQGLNLAFVKKSVFVRNLEQLLGFLYSPNHACFYREALDFFQQRQARQQELHLAEQRWQQAQQGTNADVLKQTRKTFTDLQFVDEKQRIARWQSLLQAAEALLQLSEGSQASDSQMLSARLLGGLLITSASNKRKLLLLEYAYKPLYRALLSLRLLEHLLEQQILKDPQWQAWYLHRDITQPAECEYRQKLQLPLVMATFLQHFGQLDPDAQFLLTAASDNVPEKAFSAQEREHFLALTLQGSLQLLQQGLGQLPFSRGNKEQREQHLQQQQFLQQQLHRFITAKADSPLGSLLKVPQAYTSIVLPGRSRYNYDALPRAALLMREAAARGDYNGLLVDCLFRIVGLFPQGYGVVFTPLGDDGKPQLKYEFAIVNSLYPEKPEQPGCRVVSRNQQYRNTGYNISLSTELNLYFKPARDRLKTLPEQRLKELLNMLYQDGEAKYLSRLVPKCWQPENFFSVPEHQNLWHSAQQRQN